MMKKDMRNSIGEKVMDLYLSFQKRKGQKKWQKTINEQKQTIISNE